MINTVFKEGHEDKYGIELEFNNHPKFEGGSMKLNLKTNAKMYIFANTKLVKEIQEFADLGEKPEEKIDLSYYTDRARDAAIEYINVGADYLEKASESQVKSFNSIELDLDVIAPILIVPEDAHVIKNTK